MGERGEEGFVGARGVILVRVVEGVVQRWIP